MSIQQKVKSISSGHKIFCHLLGLLLAFLTSQYESKRPELETSSSSASWQGRKYLETEESVLPKCRCKTKSTSLLPTLQDLEGFRAVLLGITGLPCIFIFSGAYPSQQCGGISGENLDLLIQSLIFTGFGPPG